MADPFREIDPSVDVDKPLAPLNWFGLGGPARYYAEPRSPEVLTALIDRCRLADVAFRVLGGGSNLLVRDEGFDGLVLRLSGAAFRQIKVTDNRVTAGAGAGLVRTISTSIRSGLAGLEVLAGIPGTVGGAVRGNTGGRAGDVAQWVSALDVIDPRGRRTRLGRDALMFTYRESNLKQSVILAAEFVLGKDDPGRLQGIFRDHLAQKKRTQPLASPSGGCVFRNVRNISTGELIRRAGLIGTVIGGASISDRHANFIVVHPGARSADVLRLIDLIRTEVRARLNVELELELDIW